MIPLLVKGVRVKVFVTCFWVEKEREGERNEREINSKMDHKSTQDQRKNKRFSFFVAQNPVSQIFNFNIYSGLNFCTLVV